MATVRLVRKCCDRCDRVITESEPEQVSDATGSQPPLLYAEAKGLGFDEPVSLKDLCPKCDKRVRELFDLLRLKENKDKKGKDEAAAEESTASEENTAPSTPEEEPVPKDEPRRRRTVRAGGESN